MEKQKDTKETVNDDSNIQNEAGSHAGGPVVLVVLDGWGVAPDGPGNAITKAKTPNMDRFAKEYPTTHLMSHGRYVGLLPDQDGNSEAGHINIGAGRIVRQDIITVTEAIKDGTFPKNMAFRETIKHAKKYNTTVHVLGLLTNGNSAHASPNHLHALLHMLAHEDIEKVRIHLFTDGRDSLPRSARDMLRELEASLEPNQKVASICGRFYAMDRNKFWDRTEKAYRLMVQGEGRTVQDAQSALAHAYERGETDEFVSPSVIVDEDGHPLGPIVPNDVMMFFNLRSDRARQLTKALVQKDFQGLNKNAFEREAFPDNSRFSAMTDFGPDLDDMFTAFPSIDVSKGLTETLHDYRQFYIGESEKYAHVTYFMNGGYAEILHGEERMRVPSANVLHAKDMPEMRAEIITDEIIRRLNEGMHDFVCVNYANADMVAHSGELKPTIEACEVVDTELGKLVDAVLAKGGHVLITGDHGNAERMIDEESGDDLTQHSSNPVPFHIVSNQYKDARVGDGMLGDVAPTILEIMGVPKPPEMTGFSLLRS